ncbi:hypothetical protein Hypma_016194 [Hypsizygus marmoreus]|uniref:Uncharacterized protein n=1 Tax=Hypsizygus marmoreus TaxID=39966 RepID=A0A369IYW4_HYPMA|nr:hypothetical protein Hypma_016194 [Hypsizygus marmoreus]
MNADNEAMYREIKLALLGRDPRHPDLFEAFNHPLRKHVEIDGYVAAGMTTAFKFEETIKLPQGTKKQIEEKGILEIVEGDFMFSRSTHGSLHPKTMFLQAWVTGRYEKIVFGKLSIFDL